MFIFVLLNCYGAGEMLQKILQMLDNSSTHLESILCTRQNNYFPYYVLTAICERNEINCLHFSPKKSKGPKRLYMCYSLTVMKSQDKGIRIQTFWTPKSSCFFSSTTTASSNSNLWQKLRLNW